MEMIGAGGCKPDVEVVLHLANDPATSEELLAVLSECEIVHVVEAVAANPSTSLEILNNLLDHPHVDVRIALTENQNISEDLLFYLSKDEEADVRYSLAENANTPRRILEELTMDANPYVQYRAEQTLARLQNRQLISHTEKISVYIAEDDEFVRTVLRLNLQRFPEFEIVGEAADGETVVSETLELQPRIVLMDVGLPKLSGIEATTKIKNNLFNTQVIMVTSNEEEADIVGSFRAGADGYYLKTSTNKDLARAIKSVINGGNWIDPGIASAVLKQCINSIRSVSKVAAPAKKADSKANPVDVLIELVNNLKETNRVGMAISICNGAIYLAQRMFGEDSEEARKCLVLLGDLYYLKEDYRESETAYLLDLMQVVNKAQAENVSDVDRRVYFLAQLCEQVGNVEQSELYYSWSLRLRERLGDRQKIDEVREKLEYSLARGEAKEPMQEITEESIEANLRSWLANRDR